MVAVVVALKLRLLRNGLRTSVWKLVGLIVGLVYALAVVVGGVAGLVALRWAPVDIAAGVTTVAFGVITFGWPVLSLLVYGVDQTVDPARFALLPVPARRLLPGLFCAALLGIPGVATALLALGLLATWSVSLPAVLAALVSAVLGVSLCVLLSRSLSAALAQFLAARRTRDVAVVVFFALVMGVSLAAQGVSRVAQLAGGDALRQTFAEAATAVGWTPVGWIWAVPGLVATGDWLGAGLRLLLTVALLAGLWRLWQWAVARNLTTPMETGGGTTVHRRRHHRSGGLPAGPAGAAALRSLLYWRRDPRYLVAMVSLIMLPVIIAAAALLNPATESRAPVALAPLLVAWLAGASIVSDLAYDGSALAHIALSGAAGRSDRVGRLVAYLLVAGSTLVVVTVVCLVLGGSPRLVPVVVAGSLVLLLSGLGAGLWIGTYLPGKAPEPGASPFAAGNGGGLRSMLALGATTGASLLASLPVVALLLGSIAVPWLAWLAVPVALVDGLLCLWAGATWGGRRLDRAWPEVYAAVTTG